MEKTYRACEIMRVDVNICTRNRPCELSLLLNSLRSQSYQDWDCVIVDESQRPIFEFKTVKDVITRLKLEDHRIKIVRNEILKGVGHARNLAIKHSKHELILRVDDDSICDRFYLGKLVELITSGNYRERGAVGGIVPPYSAPKFIRDIKFVTPIFNKIIFENDKVIIKDDGGYFYEPNAILDSDHLRSSFLFRKSAVEKVGMHPQSSTTGWREETILSMKLKWAGYKLLTDTSAICWHAHGAFGGARYPPEIYQNKLKFAEKWFQRWALRNYKKRGWKND